MLVLSNPIKKTLKQLARLMAPIVIWAILFTNIYIVNNRKNYLPIFWINLYFTDKFIFRINPDLLKWHVYDPNIMPENYFVWSGDWDMDIIPVEEHEKLVMMKELFIDKKEIEETSFYSFALNQIKQGSVLNRGKIKLSSVKNIIIYYEKQKKLYEDILNNGFDMDLASKTGVVIGRDGNLIHFREGHHTLAIAKMLGNEEVNIRIRAVHSIWLKNQLKGRDIFLLRSLHKGIEKIFL